MEIGNFREYYIKDGIRLATVSAYFMGFKMRETMIFYKRSSRSNWKYATGNKEDKFVGYSLDSSLNELERAFVKKHGI